MDNFSNNIIDLYNVERSSFHIINIEFNIRILCLYLHQKHCRELLYIIFTL